MEYRIDFNQPNPILDDRYIGHLGEHNATTLKIYPPTRMLTDSRIDYYQIAFKSGNKKISSPRYPHSSSDSISFTMSRDYTNNASISLQLEAYNMNDVLVDKSDIVTGLKLKNSVNYAPDPVSKKIPATKTIAAGFEVMSLVDLTRELLLSDEWLPLVETISNAQGRSIDYVIDQILEMAISSDRDHACEYGSSPTGKNMATKIVIYNTLASNYITASALIRDITIIKDNDTYETTIPYVSMHYFLENVNGATDSLVDRQFHSCYNLKNCALSDKVEHIPHACFYNCCSLEMAIPSSVKSIDNDGFYNCSKITVANNSFENLESVGEDALSGCSSVKFNISKLGNLTTMIDYGFNGTTMVTNGLYSFPVFYLYYVLTMESPMSWEDFFSRNRTEQIEYIETHDYVMYPDYNIMFSDYYGYHNIKTDEWKFQGINIDNNNRFSDSESEGETVVGVFAEDISNINLRHARSKNKISLMVLSSADILSEPEAIEYAINNGIAAEDIGIKFYDGHGISIDISDSNNIVYLSTVGYAASSFSSSVPIIISSIDASGSDLESLDLENLHISNRRLDNRYNFNSCRNLTSDNIHLPSDLIYIGDNFTSCTKITDLSFVPDYCEYLGSFYGTGLAGTVNIPKGVKTLYGTFNNLSDITDIVFDESASEITFDGYTFYFNTYGKVPKLTKLTFPDSMKTVNFNRYSLNSSYIDTIEFPDECNVEFGGYSAPKLAYVKFPKNGSVTFTSALSSNKISTFDFSETSVSIGSSPFTSSCKSIVFPEDESHTVKLYYNVLNMTSAGVESLVIPKHTILASGYLTIACNSLKVLHLKYLTNYTKTTTHSISGSSITEIRLGDIGNPVTSINNYFKINVTQAFNLIIYVEDPLNPPAAVKKYAPFGASRATVIYMSSSEGE